MQRLLILFTFMLSLGCEPPARPGHSVKSDKTEKDKFITTDEVSPDEEYEMITNITGTIEVDKQNVDQFLQN